MAVSRILKSVFGFNSNADKTKPTKTEGKSDQNPTAAQTASATQKGLGSEQSQLKTGPKTQLKPEPKAESKAKPRAETKTTNAPAQVSAGSEPKKTKPAVELKTETKGEAKTKPQTEFKSKTEVKSSNETPSIIDVHLAIDSRLHQAVLDNDFDEVKRLVEIEKVDVNGLDEKNENVLDKLLDDSFIENPVDMLRYLIEHGFTHVEPEILLACTSFAYPIARCLADYPNLFKDSVNELELAVVRKDLVQVQELVKNNPLEKNSEDIEPSPLFWALLVQDTDILKILLSNASELALKSAINTYIHYLSQGFPRSIDLTYYISELIKYLESDATHKSDPLEKQLQLTFLKMYINTSDSKQIIDIAENLFKIDFSGHLSKNDWIHHFNFIIKKIEKTNLTSSVTQGTLKVKAIGLVHFINASCLDKPLTKQSLRAFTDAVQFFVKNAFAFENHDYLAQLAKQAAQMGESKSLDAKNDSDTFLKDRDLAVTLFGIVGEFLTGKTTQEACTIAEDFFRLFERVALPEDAASYTFQYYLLRSTIYAQALGQPEKAFFPFISLYQSDPILFSQHIVNALNDSQEYIHEKLQFMTDTDGTTEPTEFKIIPTSKQVCDIILFLNKKVENFNKTFPPSKLIYDRIPFLIYVAMKGHDKLLSFYYDKVADQPDEIAKLNAIVAEETKIKNCTALYFVGVRGDFLTFIKLLQSGSAKLYGSENLGTIEPFIFELFAHAKKDPFNSNYYEILAIIAEKFPEEIEQVTQEFDRQWTVHEYLSSDDASSISYLKDALKPRNVIIQESFEQQIKQICNSAIITHLLSLPRSLQEIEVTDELNTVRKVNAWDYAYEKITTLETLIHPERGTGKWTVSPIFFRDFFMKWLLGCKRNARYLTMEELPLFKTDDPIDVAKEVCKLGEFVSNVFKKSQMYQPQKQFFVLTSQSIFNSRSGARALTADSVQGLESKAESMSLI